MYHAFIAKFMMSLQLLLAIATVHAGSTIEAYKIKGKPWIGGVGIAAIPIKNEVTSCAENKHLKGSGDGIIDKNFDTLNCSTLIKRDLEKVSLIIVHEGGVSVQGTINAWINSTKKARAEIKESTGKPNESYPQVAAHYEIDRDGTVYQVLDESLEGSHAVTGSRYAIGIDLAIPSGCSQTPGANGYNTCANYTNAQYAALKKLIDKISTRTAVKFNDNQVIGHCEICGTSHDDPRGVDWTKIGLDQSKHAKGPDALGCIQRWTPQGGDCEWKSPKQNTPTQKFSWDEVLHYYDLKW